MMLPLIALLWVLVVCFGGVLHAFGADWPNEPKGSERVVDCNMSTSKCTGQVKRGTFYDLYNLPIVDDPTAPLSPSKVAMAKLQKGQTQGGGQIGWYDSQYPTALYMGVKFKINAQYGCSVVGKSKTFFLRAMDNKGDAMKTNGVFMIEGCGDMKKVHWSHNTAGLDHSRVCEADLGLTCQPNVGPGLIKRGEWVTLEAYISAKGILKWWVNGQPAGSYTGLKQGTVFNDWVWSQTWDGFSNGKGFTDDAIQYVDHLVLSVAPDTLPIIPPGPGAVMDLKVQP